MATGMCVDMCVHICVDVCRTLGILPISVGGTSEIMVKLRPEEGFLGVEKVGHNYIGP